MRSILITGTDTAIGKTHVAGIIARLLAANVLPCVSPAVPSDPFRIQVVKPVESGCGAGRPADAPQAAGTWA